MTKWEYKCIGARMEGVNLLARTVNETEMPNWRKGLKLTEFFNLLGLEGWELVGLEDNVFWFKRPIISELQ